MTETTFRPWSTQPIWDDETDRLLFCKQIQTITADVKTFVLEPAEPRLFHFDPGQYLTFTVDVQGRSVERCYTISSPPTRPHVVAITVKRVPGGIMSNWLHDHLGRGGTVRARGPLGQFSINYHPAPKYLFLSGGSGVTPLMSMTRTLYDLADSTDVVFVHSARSPADIVFRRELEHIAATAANIRVVNVCEADGPTEPWGGHRGRLSIEMLQQIAPDFLEREVFTCGPAAYMTAVRNMLSATGFHMDHYHEESFTFEAPAEVVPATERNMVDTYKIEFTRTRRTIECDSETSVLAAAGAAGITLPASCGQGMCGTCKTTLLAGSVAMEHNGGIRPHEIAKDKILLCCAKPLDNLVIDA